MKLLIIGSDSEYAIERFYIKHLSNFLGTANVYFFPSQNLFYTYYKKSISNKFLFRLGLSKIYASINLSLIEKVSSFKPDVILVFKGMEIFPETFEHFKRQGIKLVNYNPDHPFNYVSRGSGNKNVLKSISYFDLYLSYSKAICQDLKNKFSVDTEWLPFGYELPEHKYKEIVATTDEIQKVCFVGTPDTNRKTLIEKIARSGFHIDVFGSNWLNFLNSHKNINVFPSVYNDELWKVLRQYRVQLNIFREHNHNAHNMRTFEVPAIGGIQLAPYSEEHYLFFKEEDEIFTYKNPNMMIEKINSILELTSHNANLIRYKARERCLSCNYSYENRSDVLINLLNT